MRGMVVYVILSRENLCLGYRDPFHELMCLVWTYVMYSCKPPSLQGHAYSFAAPLFVFLELFCHANSWVLLAGVQ
jgi:hypothetical protein